MKKLFTYLCFTLLALSLSAQNNYSEIINSELNTPDTALAKNYRVNFTVSDQPAFEILGNEPSEILKPATMNELTVAVSKFYDGKQIVLPQSFGLELNPVVLFGAKKITLDQYNNNYLWYNLRLSVATGTDTSFGKQKRNMSFGLQWTPIDEGDLRKDGNLRKELIQFNEAYSAKATEIQRKYGAPDPGSPEYKQMDVEQTSLNDLESKKVELIKEIYRKANWNKRKLSFATALLFSNQDSVLKKLTFKTLGLWGTYAQPIAKNFQLLVGLSGRINIADSNYVASSDTFVQDSTVTIVNNMASKAKKTGVFTAGARVYGGINAVKAYAEFSYKVFPYEKLHQFVVQGGLEVKVVSSLWAAINLCYQVDKPFGQNASDRFIPQLDIRWQLPESFKFN